MLGVQSLRALFVDKVIGGGRALVASTALSSNLFGVLPQTTAASPSTAIPLEDEVSFMRKLYEGWEKDPHVHSVILKGNGRGFCAGGDVAAVSLAVKAGQVRPPWAHSSVRTVCASRSDYSRSVFGGHLFEGIQYRAYSGTLSKPGGPSGPESPGFGDLTSQSVVTDDMLDSLIALKDFGNIEGLPPLDQILEEDEERDKKAMRRELERKKQLEIESKRVKTVDEFGRAYGTGRRKASTARVWIKEGEGKITINGLPHDLYFPDIDQRLQLLEPFWETNQLGVFDVRATVKGGGISGQSGALRHGISKALQLYDPTLRPALKSAGMLTRDSRVVERKKPGKAKARKSFQWVKR